MSKDVDRGAELAELARETFLWLRAGNDLPGLAGSRDLAPGDFPLIAGVYRRLDKEFEGVRAVAAAFNKLDEDQQRFASLNLLVHHILLLPPTDESVFVVGLGHVPRNSIHLTGARIEHPNSLTVVEPLLDGLPNDSESRKILKYYQFRMGAIRADLVWDLKESDSLGLYRYRDLLEYTPPRKMFKENAYSAIPPKNVGAAVFRDHLYQHATYWHMLKNGEIGKDGNYYRKYRTENPRRSDRKFEVRLLSDDYLRQCASEIVLKKGSNYLLIDLGHEWRLFRLVLPPPVLRAALVPLRVEPVIILSQPGSTRAEAGPPDWDKDPIVRAVIFHALDGGNAEPTIKYHAAHASIAPIRTLVDYRAYLRWYYGNKNVRFASDDEALETFESLLFGDQTYAFETSEKLDSNVRASLFLNEIYQASREATGQAKDKLQALVNWCEEKPGRLVLRKGMAVGAGDAKRYIMGVNSGGEVFEWNPKKQRLTAISAESFVKDVKWTEMSADIYRSTAGMLPIITVITFGGVAVSAMAVFGGAIVLQALSRDLIRKLALGATADMITKEAVRVAELHIAVALIEAVLSFVPLQDNRKFVFARGLLRGFGEGALEHYLTEIDDRFERQLQKLPQAVLAQVTKGASKWYGIYCKVEAALIKSAAVADTIEKLALPTFGAVLVTELIDGGRRIAFAILVLLFVALYLDFVYRRGPKETKELHLWLDEKGKFGKKMILETGDAMVAYANAVLHPPKEGDAHEEAMADRLKAAMKDCLDHAPAVGDLFDEIFLDTKLGSWKELTSLGFPELVSRGWDAVDEHLQRNGGPGLGLEQARILGESVGELFGTITLERRFWKGINKRPNAPPLDKKAKKQQKPHGLIPGEHLNKWGNRVFTDGIWRTLWHFVLNPIEKNLDQIIPSLKSDVADAKRMLLAGHIPKEKSYALFVADLLANEKSLATRVRKLATNGDVVNQLPVLMASAGRDDIVPPPIATILEGSDPLWPREAVLFMVSTWGQMALREIRQAIASVHNRTRFDDRFDVAQILELLNLDVALDDATVEQLRVRVSRLTE